MNTPTNGDNASVLIDQVIKQVKNAWTAQNKVVTDFFNKYEEATYMDEVSPGRSRAIYLLGHLIAANDGMLPLFGLREKLFPEYEAIFLKNPDKAIEDIPTLAELKEHWALLNATLTDYFNEMTAAQWLDRHTSVSVADFAIDPLRNKLNVLINRTNHQSYHAGQLAFLKQHVLVS